MRRKSAFVKKISDIFGIKESKVNNAGARLFSNDRQQTGSVSIADFNATHDFDLVAESDNGFYVGADVPEAFRPIAEYMASEYNRNAEAISALKDSIDKMNLTDEEKDARFTSMKAMKGLKTRAELDYAFSREGIQSGYSMSQLMGIYLYSKQEDGLRDMLTGKDGPLNTNNLTVGNILSVVDKFMYDDSFSQYRELADYMLADMGSRYDEIADVYYILNNKVLTRIPNYFMIRDELGFYDYDMSLTGQQYSKAKVNDKSTRERTGRHSLNLDVMSLFTQAIDEQEHYIAFAKLADKYDKMFFSNSNDKENDVATAYIAAAREAGHKKPQETIDTLHKWWDTIKQPGAYSGDSMPILGKVRSNMAVSVLWGNISTVLQQFPTYLLTLSKVGFKHFFSTLGKVMVHPDTWAEFVYEKSPQMRDRARLDTDVYRQQMADPNNLLYKAFGDKGAKISEAYKDFISLGLKPMETVDKWVANASWLAAYEWNLENLERADGMTDEQFDMMCSQNATQFVMDTNSSKNAKDNALIYSNRDNALKSMLLFTSQLNKQFNMMYGSFMDWKLNKDLGADINSLLRNMAVIGLAAFGAALTSGAVVPDDDDDDLEGWLLNMTKQTMLEYVGMVPFAGDTLKSIMRGYSFADSNIAETTINASKVIGRKISGDNTLKDSTYYNALAKEIAQIAELIGFPSTQPMKIYRAIRDENALDLLSTNWGKVVR